MLLVRDAKYYNAYLNKEEIYIKVKSLSGVKFQGPWFITDITVDNDFCNLTSKITYVLYKRDTGTHRTCYEDEICTKQVIMDECKSKGAYINGERFSALGKWELYRRPDECSKKKSNMDIKKIIFSGPCTIVLWQDDTKTMARVSEGESFDPEKGFAICFMKKILGHTETNKLLRKAAKQYEDMSEKYATWYDSVLNYLKKEERIQNHPLYKRFDKEDSDDQ